MMKYETDDVLRRTLPAPLAVSGGGGFLILAGLALTGCGAGAAPQSPVPREGQDGAAAPASAQSTAAATAAREPELASLLDAELLDPAREARIRELDSTDRPLPRRLAAVATDETAPPFARGNALLLLGEFGAGGQIGAFAAGLRASDPNVRAAAATGLEGLLEAEPGESLSLLRRALRDEDPWVQARALQSLGARDAATLETYIPRAPNAELRSIARSLLQLAQERGAPLAPVGPGNPPPAVLSRETAGGRRIVFRTDTSWEAWGSGVGRLSVVSPTGDTIHLADGVEAVAGVVPAFFSPEERWLVYEAARSIHVRDLETGEDRLVGAGMAPRPLPFSERFIFLRREGERGPDAGLRYGVFSAPFAGGEEERVGALTARPAMKTFGNYSPVRWMRVEQRGETFYLVGDGVSELRLPDPFGATAMP